jgi:hypothetical protein
MDQLATLWSELPEWLLQAASRARDLPYPALHVLIGLLILALLARSLAAIVLTGMLVFIAATVLLANPVDDRSWTILWTAAAASILATLLAFHRHRLARRVALLRDKVKDLSAELSDLRPKYERELIWRRAGERHPSEAADEGSSIVGVEPAPTQAPVGRFASTWRVGPSQS